MFRTLHSVLIFGPRLSGSVVVCVTVMFEPPQTYHTPEADFRGLETKTIMFEND